MNDLVRVTVHADMSENTVLRIVERFLGCCSHQQERSEQTASPYESEPNVDEGFYDVPEEDWNESSEYDGDDESDNLDLRAGNLHMFPEGLRKLRKLDENALAAYCLDNGLDGAVMYEIQHPEEFPDYDDYDVPEIDVAKYDLADI